MIDDAQYEYLIKFFDAGSLDRLKREMKTAEQAVDRLTKKAEGLQQITASLGFGSNPKGELAANNLVRTGGAGAARSNALVQGRLAARQARVAEQIVKLDEDNHRRLKKHYSALQRQQAQELASLSRQDFLNREVTTLKQAQVRAEAAKLRTALASANLLNNTDGRSTGRLSRELANAQQDEAQAVAHAERLNTLHKQNESIAKRREVIQTKLNNATARMNAQRAQGNNLEARKELLKARQLKLDLLATKQGQLTSAEIQRQVILQNRLNAAKARVATAQAGDPFSRRLADGGAGLFKIQAQLLANYAAMGAALATLGFAGRFVVQLDAQFAQLQAITATTDQAMGGLKDTLVSVSEKTKFTALEVAEAATILGQAGFSTDAIKSSIESITLLATAVGADLNTTVDLVTSTLSVFNLRAEEASIVANTFTSAVNNSKLNLDKLTLGLQYAGNIANEQNISFGELTATLGAMANSGIRAGSTLGTGLRQILTALAAPSEKLQARLRDLGLTTEDVDVKLHGFTGVLANLKDAGFTTSDAMEVLEVRAGAAFAALSNNAGTIDDLRERFLLSTAAAKANETQMEALANKGAKLQSVFGTVAYKGLAPLVEVSKIAIDTLSFLLSVLNKMGPVLPILTTTITALGVSMAALRAKTFLANTALAGHIKALIATRVTAAATATGMRALTLALGPVGLALIGITAAVVAAGAAWDAFTVSVDELQAKLDESNGRFDTYAQNIVAINKEIERLTERHFDASTSMKEVNNIALELQHKFADLGANFDFTTGSIGKLIPELERLRDVMYDLQEVELQGSLLDNDKLLEAEQKRLNRLFDVGSTSRNPLTFRNDTSLDDDKTVQAFRQRASSGEALTSGELRNFSQYLTDQQSQTITRLQQGRKNNDFGEFEEFRLNKKRTTLDNLQRQIEVMMGITADTEQKRANLAQIQFESENARFSELSIGLQADTARFTALKGTNDKEGAAALLDEIEERYSNARDQFTGDDQTKFDSSGFAQEYAGLKHNIDQFLQLSDVQIREQNELHRLRMDAAQAEIDNMLRGEKVSQSAVERRLTREEIFAALDAKQKLAREAMTAELDRTKDSLKPEKLAALTTKEIREREKIEQAFQQSDLAREVEAYGAAFEAHKHALEAEIRLEKKRVSARSSVRDIEAAKVRALEVQTDLEIAERDNLRFELRDNRERLDFEMAKLNEELAADREALGLSFDNLHRDIRETQTPRLRDSLTRLIDSFDEARQEFDDKVAQLQNPVRDAQSARNAMDAEGQAHRFSDVHRRQMDRAVEQAEIAALREEVELMKTEQAARLLSEQAEIEARNAEITARMVELQTILANYNGGDNSTSMEQARAAQTELNELTTLQAEGQEKLAEKKRDIRDNTEQILNLERELGALTGGSAPRQLGWMESLNAGLEEYMRRLEQAKINSDNFADKVVEVGETLTDSLGDALFDMATGAKSFGEAMGDMAKEVVKAILKIIAQQLALMAVTMVMRALGVPVIGFNTGGQVGGVGQGQPLGFARGGKIPSLGLENRDAVPVMAQAGEFIMRNKAVESIGVDKLYQMNARGADALKDRDVQTIKLEDTGSKEVNVYVVSPDEKPQLGPDDILHVIGEDIATGGKTKKLIKHVMMN